MGVKDYDSKTKAKAAAHDLQGLGKKMALLPLDKLRELELPERLYDAFEVLTRTRGHEGTRRQFQYIGKLMRGVEPAEIEAKLALWDQSSVEAKVLFKQCERWRDRLLSEETDALAVFCGAFPKADHDKLARLIAEARREAALKLPPKHARLIFRAVQSVLGGPAPTQAPAEETS